MSAFPATLTVEPLTPESFQPFGWVIGVKPRPEDTNVQGNAITKWRTNHVFDPGDGGHVEFVWVNYCWKPFVCERLESHRLTHQSFIPLGGSVPLIHVVAPPPEDPMAADIAPDMSRARAFLLDGSLGTCLKRGTWHGHFPVGGVANFLMITRRSTTVDIETAMAEGRENMAETVRRDTLSPSGQGVRLVLP